MHMYEFRIERAVDCVSDGIYNIHQPSRRPFVRSIDRSRAVDFDVSRQRSAGLGDHCCDDNMDRKFLRSGRAFTRLKNGSLHYEGPFRLARV
jgi:hypothetical protein